MAEESKTFIVYDPGARQTYDIPVASLKDLQEQVAMAFRQPGFLRFKRPGGSEGAYVMVTPHLKFEDLPNELEWMHQPQDAASSSGQAGAGVGAGAAAGAASGVQLVVGAAAGGMGSGGDASSEGISSVLTQLKVLTTKQDQLEMLLQREVLPRLQQLDISESSRASSSSQSGKNYIDRKQKECKEAARRLYDVEKQYCQVTGRSWEHPDVVSCSHIISRGWLTQNPIAFERAGLKNEWDPRGTLFFIKEFEQEFDRGNVCLVWSGLDGNQLDSYKVKVLEPSLLHKPLSKSDGITFGQVNGKGIYFPNNARPSKRAVNLHASRAYKKASKHAPPPNAATLDDINELPESVWSGRSWKQYVEAWLKTAE